MDIGTQWSSLQEVVGDNEEISNDSAPEGSGIVSQSKIHNNGSHFGVNHDFSPKARPKGADATDPNHQALDSKPEMSPSPRRKGNGLRKWKRIDRDSRKLISAGKMAVTHELPNSDASPSKRMQYDERKQKSEGSVSSTNAVVQNFDDLRLGLGGPLFVAGTDSENSEDQSSKSSTAASVPKLKQEVPIHSDMMGSLSGDNPRAGRVGPTKKARGDRRVNIEKENSHSSLESDSRSSNFLFVQGPHSADNWIWAEKQKHSDGAQQVSDEDRGVYDRGYEARFPPEGGGVADSSSEVKQERSEDHGFSSEEGPLDESSLAFQSAIEALEKEVLLFQEIGKDISVDDLVSDTGTEFTIDDKKEIDDLFMQKIEAEVEYLAISRTVQKLRVAAVDQITNLEDQKGVASEQTQIHDKLGVAENKAAFPKKEAEKLEDISGEIASVGEIMTLQNRACKYGSCFLVQLGLLLVILGFLMFHLSPSYMELVPT